ncbi:MAG: hypothetical protein HYY17_03725 [Planctomycetes bacterium]|nr:hypothetical protein [Planctomycetota bacterium]
MPSFSPADWLSCAIARELGDGETIAVGLATTLPFAGIMIARRTHAPNLRIGYVVGHGMMNQPRPASILWNEKLVLDRAERTWSFTDSCFTWLPTRHPKEFFRPAQIDPRGNTNNVKVGGLRLPGPAGLPDVTPYHSNIYYYVPLPSPKVFVPKVEYVSGTGSGDFGPKRVITGVAVFDFEDGLMRLKTLAPGVTREQLLSQLGFAPLVAEPLETFEPPKAWIELLRDIDPLGIRELEFLSGDARLDRLEAIVRAEMAG